MIRGARFFALVMASAVLPSAEAGEIVLTETRRDLVVRVTIDRERVKYSGEEVKLTLRVTGPGRVEVAPPRPLLAPASALSWLVHERGLPAVEKLADNRTMWTQEFLLTPYEGDADKIIKVAIELAPLRIKAGDQPQITVTFDQKARIEVETSVGKNHQFEPVTDIETLPPPPPEFVARPKPILLVGLAIALVLIVGGFILILVRRKKPDEPPLTGAPRALRDLIALKEHGSFTVAEFARVAAIVRAWLEDSYSIPAIHLTTAEAIARLHVDVPAFAPRMSTLQTLLEDCDVAKFAGDGIKPPDCADCIDRAIQLIEKVSQPVPSN